MDMASDRPGDYSTGAGLEASPGRGALPWETTEAALAGAREVRWGRRRMAWAKRLRAIGGGMLMTGIVAAIVGIPWPGVARWPLLVALALGPAMFLAGDILTGNILTGDILGGKL